MTFLSRKAFACLLILLATAFSAVEANPAHDTLINGLPSPKPYKVLTSGKHITVKCEKDINRIMVWTASGNRFVEENHVNASYYSFDVTIRERYFFLMLELKDGTRYTQKIGLP